MPCERSISDRLEFGNNEGGNSIGNNNMELAKKAGKLKG